MMNEKLLEAIGEIDVLIIWDAKADLSLGGRRKTTTRRLAALIAAILLLVALAGTTLACFGAADWFRGYFAERNGSALSDDQIEIIEDGAVDLDQSRHSNDCTITATSAISDGQVVYVQLEVTVPEGITPERAGYSYAFRQLPVLYDGQKAITCTEAGFSVLEDADPTDQKLPMLATVKFDGVALNDGMTRVLELKEFYRSYSYRGSEPVEEILAEGPWQFELWFAPPEEDIQELELLALPMACTLPFMAPEGEPEVTIQITSFKLRTLSAEMTFDYPDDIQPQGLDVLGARVVMKDGSRVWIYPSSSDIIVGDAEDTQGWMYFDLDVPIDLEEADYIQLPDGTQIPIA